MRIGGRAAVLVASLVLALAAAAPLSASAGGDGQPLPPSEWGPEQQPGPQGPVGRTPWDAISWTWGCFEFDGLDQPLCGYVFVFPSSKPPTFDPDKHLFVCKEGINASRYTKPFNTGACGLRAKPYTLGEGEFAPSPQECEAAQRAAEERSQEIQQAIGPAPAGPSDRTDTTLDDFAAGLAEDSPIRKARERGASYWMIATAAVLTVLFLALELSPLGGGRLAISRAVGTRLRTTFRPRGGTTLYSSMGVPPFRSRRGPRPKKPHHRDHHKEAAENAKVAPSPDAEQAQKRASGDRDPFGFDSQG